jgi:hypothetical protein
MRIRKGLIGSVTALADITLSRLRTAAGGFVNAATIVRHIAARSPAAATSWRPRNFDSSVRCSGPDGLLLRLFAQGRLELCQLLAVSASLYQTIKASSGRQ